MAHAGHAQASCWHLLAARARGIAVAYTPEGPANAAAELTIGLAPSLPVGLVPALVCLLLGRASLSLVHQG